MEMGKPMTNLIGQSLGRYHILEQLGEGGMATVYKAFDTRLETDVAVKVIRTENLTLGTMERALKRFEREAKALARLTHPNIVKVTDYGEYEGKPYLVMPYLPGGTLKQRLGKPIPWQEAARLLIPIAEALDFAHSQNIIHRDVKPSNILLTQSGQPMLTDFGIAKILDLEETQDLTGTSAAIGTPEYMAPEQATAKTVDRRADIYSFGIVFYEMLTGRKPFVADTPMAVLIKQATEPLPSPRRFVPNLPDAVEKVLIKALEKQPENRYQSMKEFIIAVKELLIKISASKPALRTDAPIRDPATMQKIRREVPTSAEITRQTSKRFLWSWGGGLLGVIAILSAIFWARPILDTFSPTIATDLTPIESSTPKPVLTSTPNLTLTPTYTFTPTITSTPVFTPTSIFTPTATALPTEIRDSKGVSMQLVPAGTFIMGANFGYTNEQPVHDVYLDGYYMDTYEVTNALYKTCVDTGVCDAPKRSSSNARSSYFGNSEFDNYPVIYVDWNMAQSYCEWRDGSLPTEAQWEKAARGIDGRPYPWGEGLNKTFANYHKVVGDTTAVDSYPEGKSPYGLYNLAGNVWEWVSDWYQDTFYQISPFENPLGPDSGQYRIARGGSWYYPCPCSTTRLPYLPSYLLSDLGFRCVMSANP